MSNLAEPTFPITIFARWDVTGIQYLEDAQGLVWRTAPAGYVREQGTRAEVAEKIHRGDFRGKLLTTPLVRK